MAPSDPNRSRTERRILCGIFLLYLVMSIVGIHWGLPSRRMDTFLFGNSEPWSGERIARLAGADRKLSPQRGADVDVDPLRDKPVLDGPILLTGSEADIARIYLRYRLYTYQPDEMITMMALQGMSPRALRLDPRLYQYGGLFIYPVGALIGAAGLVGLVDVRHDLAFYLDHPDEFGKFYVVARAYAAAWGLIGAYAVFAIGRRLGGRRAGLLAALLFTLMPVVVCMAHEGKPHLPGAVLMLVAVSLALRQLPTGSPEGGPPRTGSRRDWWLLCACCGAAVGMVLSSAPIFVLIPLTAWMTHRAKPAALDAAGRSGAPGTSRSLPGSFMVRTGWGILVGLAVYLATNPYVLINLFVNREVLASNFGNSLAMYEIARVHEGFVRVLELTVEGAGFPIVVFGAAALVAVLYRRSRAALALTAPAAVVFVQFVLIGAGKPAEYGRFGVFVNTALAIGAACVLADHWVAAHRVRNWLPVAAVILWVGWRGSVYLGGMYADATGSGSRIALARAIQEEARYEGFRERPVLGVRAEPAPYSLPPVNFSSTEVLLLENKEPSAFDDERVRLTIEPAEAAARDQPGIRDDSPISWANKPFDVSTR